jgi:uncharacterized protein YjiS (DUF1127 family)
MKSSEIAAANCRRLTQRKRTSMLHSLTGPASAHLSMSLSGKIWKFVALMWQSYWLRRRQRATVRMLRELDQRTLDDIGLNRSEIESVWASRY